MRAMVLLLLFTGTGTLVALALPAVALAGGGTVAPPGLSAVSQYVEDVPTVKGNRPSSSVVIPPKGGGPGAGSQAGSAGGSGTSGAGTSAQSALPAPVVKRLDHAGSAGQGAAALALATAPVLSRHKPVASGPPAAPGAAVLGSLTGVSGAGGMGVFLPLFLAVTLVAVTAAGIARRRRG